MKLWLYLLSVSLFCLFPSTPPPSAYWGSTSLIWTLQELCSLSHSLHVQPLPSFLQRQRDTWNTNLTPWIQVHKSQTFQQWKQHPPSLGSCLCLPVSLPPISHLSVQMPPSRNPGELVISLFFYADFTFGKPPLTGSLLILHSGRPVTPSQPIPLC